MMSSKTLISKTTGNRNTRGPTYILVRTIDIIEISTAIHGELKESVSLSLGDCNNDQQLEMAPKPKILMSLKL